MNLLPIRQGLNPTRAQVPLGTSEPISAASFVYQLVSTQRHRHPDDDYTAVLQRFAAGEVRLDSGQQLTPETPLPAGTFITFYRHPAPERPVPGHLRVLFQDSSLLVVDKPPFLATLPRGQHIRETALVKARVEYGIPELSPCHRLDRLTRGVLMFTTHPGIRGAYQRLFDERRVRKTYEAITATPENAPFAPIPRFSSWRRWPEPTQVSPWILRHHMHKVRGRLSTYIDESIDESDMNATTTVVGVRREKYEGQEVAVWTLQPGTGRTHQLRVVMRSLGVPILADPLYEELQDTALMDPAGVPPRPAFSSEEDFTQPMGLIATKLDFTDPFSGEHRSFQSLYNSWQ